MHVTDDLKLQKTRSVAAITRDAYRLYTDHFKDIFLQSWTLALVYAVAFALMMHSLVSLQSCWLMLACTALFAVAALLLASVSVGIARQVSAEQRITAPSHWWGSWPGRWYPRVLWHAVRWLLKAGLRHFWTLAGVVFMTGVITTVLTFFCELPAIIIALANYKAHAGEAMGDPLGMPDYVAVLSVVAFTVAGFIQAYVHLVTVLPLCYAYGSIEMIKQERTRLNI